MTLSAFEFDTGGQAAIEPVDTNDSRVQRTRDTIVVKQRGNERVAAYFRLDPRLSAAGDYHCITVEYLDRGTGHWFIEHDRIGARVGDLHAWSRSEKISLADSGQWLRVAIPLQSPRWTGSLENADFRIVILDPSASGFVMRGLDVSEHGDDAPGDCHTDPEPGTDRSSLPRSHRYVKPSPGLPLTFTVPGPVSVSIIVPVFNRLAYTRDCLHGIMEFTPAMYEVIVVDNGSTDGSGDWLAGVPGLRLLRNETNHGFARACNAGAAIARGEWLLFLNNDTIPQPGWLTAMIAAAERDPRIAIVGSKLIYPQSETVQHGGVSFGTSRLPQHDYEHADPDHDAVSVDREVDAVTGACLLTRRARFRELDGFDTGFVNGFEDVDFCLRARQQGGRILFCAHSRLLHYKSVSAPRIDTRTDKANIELFRSRWDRYIADHLVTGVPASAGDPGTRGNTGNHADGEALTLTVDRLPHQIRMHRGQIRSQTGMLVEGAVVCRAGDHPGGHCVYGGYLEVEDHFEATAEFLVQVSNCDGRGGAIATIDVYDYARDEIQATGDLKDPGEDRPLSRCPLRFTACPGQILEFRVFWRGRCDLAVAGIDILAAPAA